MQFDHNILVGYSGHGYVVAEAALAAGLTLDAYADRHAVELNPFGLTYFGLETDELFEGYSGKYGFVLGIGQNELRLRTALFLGEKNVYIHTVIHPSAQVSTYARLGSGCFVARNAAVSPLAVIGDYCILNTSCVVEHECVIDTAAHIAPGAVLAGNVKVGKRSFIGAGAVVRQGIVIGDDVTVGAGAVVVKNIDQAGIYAGNPVRKIR